MRGASRCWVLSFALAALLALAACYSAPAPDATARGEGPAVPETIQAQPAPPRPDGPGFRSTAAWNDHYSKHRREFGSITRDEYLALAQQLRDAPLGGSILELVRQDGVTTRFERRTGHFGAYNRDGTIRTFFVPNDGERYFARQATRPH